MKKTAISLIFVFICIFSVFSQSRQETEETVKMAVMQGPTGFSASMLDSFIALEIYPSPNEAVAKLINGELDMAVIPANSAATLFNKGVGIKALAITGEGMLSIVGEPENTESTILVPGAGATPDHFAPLLYPQFVRDYSVGAPAQAAQLLIAGKKKLAILPEPFATLAVSKNPKLGKIDDVQLRWKEKTGFEQYPMSILVATDKFLKENPNLAERVLKSYANSVAKTLENPQEAAQNIEKLGIMNAENALPSIQNCALVFKTGKQAQEEALAYYSVLYELAPEAIGNRIPQESMFVTF